MIDNNNFIVIQGFMINELKLKGNDLLIYAIIYGFSQGDNQYFTGSRQYLADWTNSTTRGVQKNLNTLVDKGLIEKVELFQNGVKYCKYRTTSLKGEKSSLEVNGVPSPSEQSSHNNIDNNIDNIIKSNEEKRKDRKEKATKELETIINNYSSNEDLITTIKDFIEMRKQIKKPITPIGLKRMLNKLDKLASRDEDKIEILGQSILRNWQDIYQLKRNNYNGNFSNFNKNVAKNEQKNVDNFIEI